MLRCPAPEVPGGESLVISVRSGDLFRSKDPATSSFKFGQPPLGFYLAVLAAVPWDSVTVVAEDDSNPVIGALQRLAVSRSSVGSDTETTG
ncbi:unnamed protein product, partial [Phaeothamnion confervicola]